MRIKITEEQIGKVIKGLISMAGLKGDGDCEIEIGNSLLLYPQWMLDGDGSIDIYGIEIYKWASEEYLQNGNPDESYGDSYIGEIEF